MTDRTNYNFDPIFMGDGNKVSFDISMNDISKHNFFLSMTQEVVPRKCLRIADDITNEPVNELSQILTEDGTN